MTDAEQVELVFNTIGTAAHLLAAVKPGECAKVFRSQMDRAFYTDPTLAQQVLAKSKDVERKLKLLDAAETFLQAFLVVGAEVIAEAEVEQAP